MYYKEQREKKCPICSNLFSTLKTQQKYCSFACSLKGTELKRNKRRVKYEKQSILKFGLHKETPKTMTFKCKWCKQKYTRPRSQVKKRGTGFCSVECRQEEIANRVPTDKMILTVWAEVVKLYDGNKCAYCGKTSYLNSHHIFSRSNHNIRYDLNNGITLCAGNHTLSSTFSAHKTPVEFVEWIKAKRGEEWYNALRLRAKTQIAKYTKDDLRTIYRNLIEVKEHFKEKEYDNHRDNGDIAYVSGQTDRGDDKG